MLWGGRFSGELNKLALEFSSSLNDDVNLIEQDVRASIAHAKGLAASGIIPGEDAAVIISGLEAIISEYRANSWQPLSKGFEDIHSAIETRLTELIGPVAGKLHTGRSRNDQVAADMRLWVKENSASLIEAIRRMQTVLVSIAEKNTESVIPGYTHLQRAQPVSLAFILLAYVEMLERDASRLTNCITAADASPLGAGAMAGSSLPLNREAVARDLGFAALCRNAYDAVSDRDFVLDFLHCCSTGMLHLSRLCEEIVIWSSAEWNLLRLSDEYTTGSSLMPQKKNPDMAELIRGKTGRVIGNETGFKTTVKGLPLSYNRDLQEDKRPMFDSFKSYYYSLLISAGMLESAEFNLEKWPLELDGDSSTATDLADWLVKKGIAFREAHRYAGLLVKYAEDKKVKLNNLSAGEIKNILPVFDDSVLSLFSIANVLSRKVTQGSPNPVLVMDQINFWKQRLSI